MISLRRAAVLLGFAWLVAAWSTLAVELARQVQFEIAPQPLSAALIQFSKQAEVQVVAAGHKLDGISTKGVRGRYSIAEALRLLLEGTGIEFRPSGTNTILLAPTAPSAGGTSSPRTASPLPSDTTLEKIVVTAQKRSERLLDVPVPVTVLSPDALTSTNEVRLQDFYTQVPNLNLVLGNRGEPALAIRGLTTAAGTNPVVGVTVDDVPMGSSIGIAGGFLVPDFDPSDLSQIEVLRGPQGTLYGASSMGGLVKYVTKNPSTIAASGRVEGALTNIQEGKKPGGSLGVAVNLPASDRLAFRLSAFGRQDPG